MTSAILRLHIGEVLFGFVQPLHHITQLVSRLGRNQRFVK
jgi:hypothetical protein